MPPVVQNIFYYVKDDSYHLKPCKNSDFCAIFLFQSQLTTNLISVEEIRKKRLNFKEYRHGRPLLQA